MTRAALRDLLDFLRPKAVSPARTIPVGHETETPRVVRWLTSNIDTKRAGWPPATIQNYMPFGRTFPEHRFGTGQVILSTLDASDRRREIPRACSTRNRNDAGKGSPRKQTGRGE